MNAAVKLAQSTLDALQSTLDSLTRHLPGLHSMLPSAFSTTQGTLSRTNENAQADAPGPNHNAVQGSRNTVRINAAGVSSSQGPPQQGRASGSASRTHGSAQFLSATKHHNVDVHNMVSGSPHDTSSGSVLRQQEVGLHISLCRTQPIRYAVLETFLGLLKEKLPSSFASGG